MRGMPRLGRGGAISPAKMGARLSLLLGESRRTVAALAGASVLSGFTEAAMLAVLAQIAVVLAGNKSHHGTKLQGLDIHLSTNTLLLAAFVLAFLRLLMQFPLSVLPSRIAADVQSTLRKRLFTAFTLASWGVQSSDREGQLQETMSGQVVQATSGALQATSLITSTLNFLVLMAFAFALNALAATGVFIAAIAMFAVLRPLRKLAVRRSRALSKAQVRYSAAIAESNRLAEETQVFGVAGGSARPHRRLHRLRARPLLQLPAHRPAGAEHVPEPHLRAARAGARGAETRGRRARGVPRRGDPDPGAGGLERPVGAIRLPGALAVDAVHRTHPGRSAALSGQRSARRRGAPRADRDHGVRARQLLLPARQPHAEGPQLRGRAQRGDRRDRPLRSGQVDADPAAAAAAQPGIGALPRQRRAGDRVPPRRTGTGWSHTCRSRRACSTRASRRTSATSATSPTRRSNAPRSSPASTRTWPAGARAIDTLVGPRADAVSGGQAAAHLPRARACRARPRCSCSTSPRARSTRTPRR